LKPLGITREAWISKIAAFRKLSDAQCKVYGIPAIQVVPADPKDMTSGHGLVEFANFDPSDKKIHVDFSLANSFEEAVEHIFHEVAHSFQGELADKFVQGEIKPVIPSTIRPAYLRRTTLHLEENSHRKTPPKCKII
jgi:hypothetical protein